MKIIKWLAKPTLIRLQRMNPKLLGHVWTHHSTKKLTSLLRIESFTFWPLFPKWLNPWPPKSIQPYLFRYGTCGTISKLFINFYSNYQQKMKKKLVSCPLSLLGSSSNPKKINSSLPFGVWYIHFHFSYFMDIRKMLVSGPFLVTNSKIKLKF